SRHPDDRVAPQAPALREAGQGRSVDRDGAAGGRAGGLRALVLAGDHARRKEHARAALSATALSLRPLDSSRLWRWHPDRKTTRGGARAVKDRITTAGLA